MRLRQMNEASLSMSLIARNFHHAHLCRHHTERHLLQHITFCAGVVVVYDQQAVSLSALIGFSDAHR